MSTLTLEFTDAAGRLYQVARFDLADGDGDYLIDRLTATLQLPREDTEALWRQLGAPGGVVVRLAGGGG